jgi:hypothetical protein
MKAITNESLQSFNIFLSYPSGVKSVYIKPKETLVVPAPAVTDQVELMARRRILKIREA